MRKLVTCALLAFAASTTAKAGAISEVRFGVLAHDPLIQKEDGVDLNGELFFSSWTEGSWELRPSLGGSVSLSGDTSFVYVDLNYGGPISDSLFLEFGVGGAIHDGKLETADPGRKELGGRVLIHAAMSLGVKLTDTMSLSIFADHMSNAGIEERNEGMETAGLRLGFRM